MSKQATVAEIEAYVATVREQLSGLPFRISPNNFGWHARCTVSGCGEGFTESGGATITRLLDHAATHEDN